MNILGSCNSCLLEVEHNTKHIYCPDCNRLYHQDCWKKNSDKCIEFGCKGTKETINVPIIVNTRNANNRNSSVSALTNSQKIIIFFSLSIILFIVLISYKLMSTRELQATNSQNNSVNESIRYDNISKSSNNSTISVEPTILSTPKPVPTISITPEEIEYIPTLDPNPDIDLEKEQIKELVIKAREVKNKGFLEKDYSGFSSVFTDKALKELVSGVQWCIDNNAYKDTLTKSINITNISREKDIYTVTANISEKSDYYENGKYDKKHSYDKSYIVKYYIIKTSDDEFKISKADVKN